ncbi:MAG: tRNA epoxyqueuosine(34) reductase QueG [Bacteroidetes bacterium]|nr:tRNA epoxyqueuosine(34) reductase QueG [Bacteroidota bacterium]
MNWIASKRSEQLKQWSRELGFLSCGMSKATFLEEEAPRLEQWLKNNGHGQMDYMANHFDKRLDPRELVPGAKTVISLLYNYFPEKVQTSGIPKISKYAYGEDYHVVVKDKMKILWQKMTESWGEIQGRMFVDSAPVLERAWAVKSGLGWQGKNGNLIQKKAGSFFFLAEMIVDVEISEDGPVTDHCGSCTLCIDACPTDAIVKPYVVDGSRCISYFTIELKSAIDNQWKGQWDDWVFGCDICQDVCPWNRFSKPHQEPRFNYHAPLLDKSWEDWQNTTEEEFKKLTKGSPLSRAKWSGMMKNLSLFD